MAWRRTTSSALRGRYPTTAPSTQTFASSSSGATSSSGSSSSSILVCPTGLRKDHSRYFGSSSGVASDQINDQDNHHPSNRNHKHQSTLSSSGNSSTKILAGAYSAQQSAVEFAKLAGSTSSKNYIDADGDSLSVSPEVITSMINGALEKGDDETLRLVVMEADRVGRLNSTILESCIVQCLHAHDLHNASILLSHANKRNFLITQPVCQQLLQQLINYCEWDHAATVACYMIGREYVMMGDRDVFFIVGGLMKDSVGVEKALHMMTMIIEKRRGDLAGLFSYTKVNRFSHSMGGSHSRRSDVSITALQRVVDTSLTAMHTDGWFSFSLSKMIVAVACGARHEELAMEYIRKTVDAVVQGKIAMSADGQTRHMSRSSSGNGSSGSRDMDSGADHVVGVDLLSVLRSFSQGIGVANAEAKTNYRPNQTNRMDENGNAPASNLSPGGYNDEMGSLVHNNNNNHEHNTGNSNNNGSGNGSWISTRSLRPSHMLLELTARYMPAMILGQYCGESARDNSSSGIPMSTTRMGPLQAMDLFKMYWILAYSVRGNATPLSSSPSSSSTSSSSITTKNTTKHTTPTANTSTTITTPTSVGDPILRQNYHKLVEFLTNSERSSAEFTPLPGYSRKTFRVLCDTLGIRHKILEKDSTSTTPKSTRRSHLPWDNNTWGGDHTYHNDRVGTQDMTDIDVVRVWKIDGHVYNVIPPSLAEILRLDAKKGSDRKFDAEPYLWDVAKTQLAVLCEQKKGNLSMVSSHRHGHNALGMVALNVTHSLMNSYASSDWALQWLDLLKEEGVFLSRGLLRNTLHMCSERKDVYGLLEVLYASQREDQRLLSSQASRGTRRDKTREPSSNNTSSVHSGHPEGRRLGVGDGEGISHGIHEYQADIPRSTSSGYRSTSGMGGGYGTSSSSSDSAREQNLSSSSSPSLDEEHDGLNSRHSMSTHSMVSTREEEDAEDNAPTTLRQRDWNKACLAAWHSRVADIPKDSFREAFTEVMRLMRESNVSLESSTTRTLLRFLVHTQPTSDITWKIIRRLYRDKSFPLCHIELVAISSLLLRRLSSHRSAVSLALPLYRSENYLFVYPGALTHIVDQVSRHVESLSVDFVENFELAWRDVYSTNGRATLYQLMLRTVSAKGQRTELIRTANDDTRRVISLVCAYSAYLMGAQDGQYRQAYDLLYAIESLNREAEEYQIALAQEMEEEEQEREEGMDKSLDDEK